jgi:SagB-type dehydrogenase family enzyme
MPPPVKRYRGVPTIDLPRADPGDEFGRIARARRTWRRFAADPVTVEELAAVLGLSVGVQKWVRIGGRELPLKTSPSGGARHPVEAYVVVRRVRGLAAGIYHYHGGRHVLERLRRVPSRERIRSYLPFSEHATSASALVLFTAMFERQLWRYPYSRAYRAAFIEAGHVCQTFCLAATALGLAPFSIMALADSLIERDLGLDGITESVLYAAGVGRPPARASWAPRLRGTLSVRPNPRLRTKSE